MKIVTTIFAMLCIFSFYGSAQESLVAGWTFPNSSAAADTGTLENMNSEIETMGGTSDLDFKNGFETKAAQVTNWNDGANEKAWVISINTLGYTNLNLSSRQQSGGNEPGPKYYKLQYSIDNGVIWSDIGGGDITVENDWETSFVDHLILPEDCNDKNHVMIRWLMTSEEASLPGGNVLESGKSKIDNIYIYGEVVNSISHEYSTKLKIYPDAASGYLNIQSEEEIESIVLCTLEGKVHKVFVNSRAAKISLNSRHRNTFLIYRIQWKNSRTIYAGKVYIP